MANLSREERLWFIRELIPLGVTATGAARLLGLPAHLVHADLKACGGIRRLAPERPDGKQLDLVQAAVVLKLSYLDRLSESRQLDEKGERLRACLLQWIEDHPEAGEYSKAVAGRKERGVVVNDLYNLGLGSRQIARLTGWSVNQVRVIIRELGGPNAFPHRPTTKEVTFQDVLRVYAEIWAGKRRVLGIGDMRWYLDVLGRWLGVGKVLGCLRGVEWAAERLTHIQHASQDTGRVQLYLDLVSVEPTVGRQYANSLWHEFLLGVVDRRPLPTSQQQVLSELQPKLLVGARERVWPRWGEQESRLLDEAVETLDDRAKHIIRSHYGIGCEPIPQAVLAKQFDTSHAWIQQLRLRALRTLRQTKAVQTLFWRVRPLSVLQDQVDGLLRDVAGLENEVIARSEMLGKLERLSAGAPAAGEGWNENLYKRIDELDLSVRSANCLQNLHTATGQMEFVWQLVQKSEADLLKTKNFGRKSLNEIKEVLKEELGLSLGMNLRGFPFPQAT